MHFENIQKQLVNIQTSLPYSKCEILKNEDDVWQHLYHQSLNSGESAVGCEGDSRQIMI